MTYEEAKDQVAESYGWNNSGEFELNDSISSESLKIFQEAAELYAQSKVKEALEMAAAGGDSITKQSILNVYDKIFKA